MFSCCLAESLAISDVIDIDYQYRICHSDAVLSVVLDVRENWSRGRCVHYSWCAGVRRARCDSLVLYNGAHDFSLAKNYFGVDPHHFFLVGNFLCVDPHYLSLVELFSCGSFFW